MLSNRTILACYGLVALLAGGSYLWDRQTAAGASRLEARKVHLLAMPVAELRLQGRTFREAVQQLSRAGGVPIRLDEKPLKAAGIDGKETLRLTLFDLPLERMLNLLLSDVPNTTQLAWMWQGDAILITTADQAAREPAVIRVYDVRDLDLPATTYDSGPVFDGCFGSPQQPQIGLFSGREISKADARYDDVIKLITTTVAPETWRDAGGTLGSASVADGRLIITQTGENQRQVAHLLDHLRTHGGDEWPEPLE